MEVGVAEAARLLGVSERRVRALSKSQRLRAREVSGRWLIDAASIPRRARPAIRPMSQANAWALALGPADWDLDPKAAYRLRQARSRLAQSNDPISLLGAWLASRASRLLLAAPEPKDVLADERLVPSGVSDERSFLSAAHQAEGYVRARDLDDLSLDHLLVASSQSNVILHVAAQLPPRPLPLLLLVADLIEHDGPRELARARELLDSAVLA